MNKNIFITVVVVLIVLIAGVFIFKAAQPNQSGSTEVQSTTSGTAPTYTETTTSTTTTTTTNSSPLNTSGQTTSSTGVSAGVNVSAKVIPPEKDFTITASNYSFSPKQITVNKGDIVKITVVNSEGFHDFHIDAYGIATAGISSGQQKVVTFTATKAGSFQFYCSFHKAMGMTGTLVVQ